MLSTSNTGVRTSFLSHCRPTITILTWLLLALVMAACPRSPASADQVGAPSGRPIQVFVSVLPQRYFAERLAGERAIVEAGT